MKIKACTLNMLVITSEDYERLILLMISVPERVECISIVLSA